MPEVIPKAVTRGSGVMKGLVRYQDAGAIPCRNRSGFTRATDCHALRTVVSSGSSAANNQHPLMQSRKSGVGSSPQLG